MKTLTRPTPVPPKHIHHYRKHLGYFCRECQSEKRLQFTQLCDCLLFEEDPKVIKRHINDKWEPIYADF